MQLHYHIGAFISVALGIANPSSWPPLFGHMRDVDSVAGFWSGCWHGMLTETIRGVWEIFGLRPTGVLANGDAGGKGSDEKSTNKIGMSGIVKVLTAFALSGAGHALAMWTASGSILWKGQMLFFLSQVLVLMTEHVIGWKGKRRGSTQKTKFVGQVWTVAVILLTGVWMADEMGRVGMYRANPVPGSIIRPALRKLGMWDGPE